MFPPAPQASEPTELTQEGSRGKASFCRQTISGLAGVHGGLNWGPLSLHPGIYPWQSWVSCWWWMEKVQKGRLSLPGGRADVSLGLAGKLGAQGSPSLGQQCSRENTHEPCVEHFSGLTHGCSCRTGADMRNIRQQVTSPVRSPCSLSLAQPGIFRIFLSVFLLSPWDVFVWLVLVFF